MNKTGENMGQHGRAAAATGTRQQPRGGNPWVVTLIAGASAAEVWATWLGLGSVSGFPVLRLGHHAVSTDWTLAIGMEAYGGYALRVWLGGAGARSRTFAMWSAIGAFTLSLVGQIAYHVMLDVGMHRTPVLLVGFVACLPVIVLILAALLTHFMQEDQRAAAEALDAAERAQQMAAAERAEHGELAALRAQLADEKAAREEDVTALRAQLDAAASAVTSARRQAEAEAARAEAEARRAETLARKLAAASAPPRKPAGSGEGQKRQGPATGEMAAVPEDIDTQAAALEILAAEPGISGSELGRRLGKSERYGRMLQKELTKAGPPGSD